MTELQKEYRGWAAKYTESYGVRVPRSEQTEESLKGSESLIPVPKHRLVQRLQQELPSHTTDSSNMDIITWPNRRGKPQIW